MMSRRRWLFPVLIAAFCGATAICLWSIRKPSQAIVAAAVTSDETSSPAWEPPGTLVVSRQAVSAMQLQAAPARTNAEPQTLRLTGRLMYDPNVLVHVNTRFSGEVIRIGDAQGCGRSLRVGDRVAAGQLLAIIWSKEIGEKKSDLVEALSQMALHESTYKNLKALEKSGAVSQRSIDEMERLYVSDLIQVERCRRTLRSWKIDETELAEVEQEAQLFHDHVLTNGQTGKRHRPTEKNAGTWAEIDIKAPLNGVILEKNLTVGDIVNTDDDLFKVADLSRLVVMANLYEDDLPALLALPADERTWRLRFLSQPKTTPITGKIETIGSVIDPSQHTAIVQGWVDNAGGELRVGQFVEALVNLPAPTGQVEIPVTGLIDDGARKQILVALDDSLTRIQKREVQVTHRTNRSAFLQSDGPMAVRDGERVIISGVLEISRLLDDLHPRGSAP